MWQSGCGGARGGGEGGGGGGGREGGGKADGLGGEGEGGAGRRLCGLIACLYYPTVHISTTSRLCGGDVLALVPPLRPRSHRTPLHLRDGSGKALGRFREGSTSASRATHLLLRVVEALACAARGGRGR